MELEPYAYTFPEALERIMEERSWKQDDLAAELGTTQSWVSRAVRGRYDLRLGRMVSLLDRVGLRVELRIYRKGDKVKRRELHKKVVSVAGAVIVEKVAGVAFVPSSDSSPYQDADHVLALSDRAAQHWFELGGGPIARPVLHHARKIKTALPGGGEALRVAASEFYRQSAWIVYDAGNVDLAIKFAHGSLALAIKNSDTEKQAAARVVLSELYSQGKMLFDLAAFHAAEGLKLPDVSGVFCAALNVNLGWAMSQREWAGGSIIQAQRYIDRAQDFDELSGLDRAWISDVSGCVLDNIGEHEKSLASLWHAIRLSASAPHQQAAPLAYAVKAALGARNLELARHLTKDLAHVAPLVDSAILRRNVGCALESCVKWGDTPEIRGIRAGLQSIASPRRLSFS